jgi:4-hydroxybenzoate polyprenyltransferase
MSATSSKEPAAAAGSSPVRTLSALFVSLRPAQWMKNLVLPLPFLFGAALRDWSGWVLAAAGFGVFCAVSSGVYLINDVKDRERDRAHPSSAAPLATGI